ncbi:MAG: zinc-ribbon domain-containing protein [Deltaproteobacteria bacterium]|nr:zinc-ribbon domain-containing protein [Deltaproteobacteria bacterium]
MEVRCPKCQTIYHLDETQIPNEGANVKCTACQNIFKVSAPAVRQPSQQTNWHLKKPDGSIVNFKHLGELQKLILEYKANLEDMISKDGVSYKKLSDMPEFAPLFLKRNQLATGINVQGASPTQVDQDRSQEPKSSVPQVQSVVTPISIPQEEEVDVYGRPKKESKKSGLLIAFGVVIIIIAIVVYFFKDRIMGPELTEEETAALKIAQEEILRLDYSNLERAYNELEKLTKNQKHPPKMEILATLTHSLLLRGELLKLENFVVERRIKEILNVDKYSEVAKKLNEAFNERQRIIQDISNITMTNLRKLDMSYGSESLAKYVSLEYIRIQVVFDKSSAEKGRMLLKDLVNVKDFPYSNRLKFIEGDLILKTDEARAEEGIRLIRESLNAEKGFILPHFMLVRYFVSKGEYEKAGSEVDIILSSNPNHSVAQALKEHIQDLINITKTGQPSKVEGTQAVEGQKNVEEKTQQREDARKEVTMVPEKTREEKPVKDEKMVSVQPEKKEVAMKAKADKATAPETRSGGNYSQLIKQAKNFAAKGQIDKAADTFLQAAELEPTLAEPFLLMGWMYIDAGKNEQAVNSFLRAIKLKGNKCDGYMGLGEANKYMKRNSEAKKYYQMYLEQCPNGPDAVTARNNLNTLK